MTWQQYVNRRSVDITSWIRVNNIKDYAGFVSVCKGKRILPPSESELSVYFKGSDPGIQPVEEKLEQIEEAPVTTEPVVIREPVPDSVITPPDDPVEQEPVAEDQSPPVEGELDDPAEMGVYDVDNEGFLVVKQQASSKKVFGGGRLRSATDLGDD